MAVCAPSASWKHHVLPQRRALHAAWANTLLIAGRAYQDPAAGCGLEVGEPEEEVNSVLDAHSSFENPGPSAQLPLIQLDDGLVLSDPSTWSGPDSPCKVTYAASRAHLSDERIACARLDYACQHARC
eukprot:1920178-Rhodomonas_salina.1